MANLNYSVGEPTYDWYELIDGALDNGMFGVIGGSHATLSLTSGTTTLVLNGTGLSASGARVLASGTITSMTLIENGTTVVTADTFSPAVTASSIQSVLAAFDGGGLSIEQALFILFGSQPMNIQGSTDRDVLFSGSGNDVIDAGGGSDNISTGAGNDVVDAGSGDDFIRGGAGVDTIDGGDDYDTIGYYGNAGVNTAGVNVVMNTSGVAGGGTVTGTLQSGTTTTTFVNVERIEGTDRNDTFFVDNGFVGTDFSDDAYFDNVGRIASIAWVGAEGNDTFTDVSTTPGGLSQINYDAEKFTRDQQVWGDDPGEYGVIVNISDAAISANIGNGMANVAAGTAIDTYGDVDTINGVVQFRLTDTRDYFVAGNRGSWVRSRGGDDTLIGGAGEDHLHGQEGNDTIIGGGGRNDLRGGEGNDTITGGDSRDQIEGDGGDDTISAGDGDDDIHTGYGDDTVSAGGGNFDFIDVEEGTDVIHGDAGFDMIDIRDSDDVTNRIITINGANGSGTMTGTATSGHSFSVTFDTTERIRGSSGNDTFTATAGLTTTDESNNINLLQVFEVVGGGGADTFTDNTGSGLPNFAVNYRDEAYEHEDYEDDHRWGEGAGEFGVIVNLSGSSIMVNVGNGVETVAAGRGRDTFLATDTFTNVRAFQLTDAADYLVGGSSNLWIQAERGNDVVIGSSGSDYINGGDGNDTLSGAAGMDLLEGDRGADTLNGGDNNDQLSGGDDNDTLNGDGGNDQLNGDQGADILNGGLGADRLSGGGDNDTLRGDAGNDRLNGDDGNDTLEGGAGNDELSGGSENDTLFGGADYDRLYGDEGNDLLDGGTGADEMDGGDGSDTYIVDTLGDIIREFGSSGIDLVQSSVSFNLTGLNIENLTLVGAATIGIGNQLNNLIIGNGLANVLSGGAGSDVMRGMGGNDTYYVDAATDTIDEVAGNGTSDRVLTTTSFNLAADDDIELFETTNVLGTAAINLVGNTLSQTIIGNAGANTLVGGGGNDVLRGLGGNDSYFIDSQTDIIDEVINGGALDRVYTTVSFTLASDDNIESMQTTNAAGTVAINLIGNTVSQTIIGNAGANTLVGGGGDDVLTGLGGNDNYFVDSQSDIINEVAGGGTADRVYTAGTFVLAADDNIEFLATTNAASTAAINLVGNALSQTITGNAGVNVIYGGLGNDTLQGLGGSDIFVFNTALGASNVDTLSDFTAADTVYLENAVFTALAGTGTLTANQFVSNTTGLATTAAQRIIYESDTGNLYYDSNGNAAGGSVLFAHLTAGLVLTSADFFII
jgi:Ca2+-binding RTX toxin-like protein